jgi:hypothetical protein
MASLITMNGVSLSCGLQGSRAKAKSDQSSLIRQFRGPVPARGGEDVGPRPASPRVDSLDPRFFQVLCQKHSFHKTLALAFQNVRHLICWSL